MAASLIVAEQTNWDNVTVSCTAADLDEAWGVWLEETYNAE